MSKKATLSTAPVAWTDGIPLKYQAKFEYPATHSRTIAILSSPMSSEKEALEDLYKELSLWKESINAFTNICAVTDHDTDD